MNFFSFCGLIIDKLILSGSIISVFKRIFKIYKQDGFSGVKRGIVFLYSVTLSDRNNYQKWISLYDTLSDVDRNSIKNKIYRWERCPLISILMPVYNPPDKFLEQAIESVKAQLYPYWELCIADDASNDPGVVALLKKYANEDPRIKVVFRSINGHISAASNTALEMVSGEFIALFDNDDLLPEHALFWIAKTIVENPDVSLIYSDEDKIDELGNRYGPYFKCDWNPDLFLSHNMVSHLGVYKTDLVKLLGGFRVGYEGSQDYDLALRCTEYLSISQIVHIPRVLYHWRSHAGSTARSGTVKEYAFVAGARAINDHFNRIGVSAKSESLGFGMYRSHYDIPVEQPMVSIVISILNMPDSVRKCIESIINKTTYINYEIIVLTSDFNAGISLDYLASLKSNIRIEVKRYDELINSSQLINSIVKDVKGTFIAFLDHVEVITPTWLEQMIGLAFQPKVGCVGARLWYSNDTLFNSGYIIGIGGVVGAAHRGLPKSQPGYLGRAQLIQTVSCLSSACLLIKKSIYQEVGGVDERYFTEVFSDVDFCLRVKAAGYRNIWTPYAEFNYLKPMSDEQKYYNCEQDLCYLKSRWGELLLSDQAYSPNLTLKYEDFSLAWPPRI
jgi:glycosyltransferase involved in cell wall biosynthesis